MRRDFAFAPHFCPLSNPETVLLINNYKPKIAELNGIFNQSMSADYNMQFTRLKHGMYFLAPRFLCAAGQQIRP